jgi:hypothetical protein
VYSSQTANKEDFCKVKMSILFVRVILHKILMSLYSVVMKIKDLIASL